MHVVVRYLGCWGLGDLLCSDPLIGGLIEEHGPRTTIWLEGHAGNVVHNPRVAGPLPTGVQPDRVVEVRGFTHMDAAEYGELEALPSLIDHMCSYAAVAPTDRRPRLHLSPDEENIPVTLGLDRLPQPRIAICADYVDPLRHWPVEHWREVATRLRDSGATIVEVGQRNRLGIGIDLVGRLSVRQTAAVLGACSLFLGNNSGLLHYAQAAGVPCVGFVLAGSPRSLRASGRRRPRSPSFPPALHRLHDPLLRVDAGPELHRRSPRALHARDLDRRSALHDGARSRKIAGFGLACGGSSPALLAGSTSFGSEEVSCESSL